jgi:hypothetical protein
MYGGPDEELNAALMSTFVEQNEKTPMTPDEYLDAWYDEHGNLLVTPVNDSAVMFVIGVFLIGLILMCSWVFDHIQFLP